LRQRCGRLHVANCNLNISFQRHWWVGLLLHASHSDAGGPKTILKQSGAAAILSNAPRTARYHRRRVCGLSISRWRR
jgi:hypothetical protein